MTAASGLRHCNVLW